MKKHTAIISITAAVIISVLFAGSLFLGKPDITPSNKKHNTEILTEHQKKMRGLLKYDSPGMFAEFHAMIRKDLDGRSYPHNYMMRELNKAVDLREKSGADGILDDLNWVERGPSNVGGRTRQIFIDIEDPTHSTWFCGSVSGGVWKTNDRGETWRNMTPDFPNLATCVLVQSPSHPNILYCGTGEGYFNNDGVRGSGIFKSSDKGESWYQLENTASFQTVNRIVVHPDNPEILLCCTVEKLMSNPDAYRFYEFFDSKIYKSGDGGETWYEVHSSGRNSIQQIIADPTNFNTLYASVNSRGVIKSTDMGETWFDTSEGLKGKQRIEMAIAPTDPQRLYLSVENGSNSDFYVSYDGAEKWYLAEEAQGSDQAWLGTQGGYDNTIIVNPYDEDHIIVGGIDLHEIRMLGGEEMHREIGSVNFNNTNPWMSFVNLGLSGTGGGIGKADEIFPFAAAAEEDYVSCEVRFGPDEKQMAHLFEQDGSNFKYIDYVEVPFTVWDIENSKQLAASFLDVEKDGSFNLSDEQNISDAFVIHAIDYKTTPDPTITTENGTGHKAIFVAAPYLKSGQEWTPDNLPESSIRINWTEYITKRRDIEALTDGYGRWGFVNYRKVHVDQHYIAAAKTNEANEEFLMVVGNDGGAAFSTDAGENWKETDDMTGYNTAQFYGCDKCPGKIAFVGGTQDNGTYVSSIDEEAGPETGYEETIGGDGFEASWHFTDPKKIIGGSQFNNFMRTTDGGETWQMAVNGLSDRGSGKGIFLSRLAKSQSDPEILFALGTSGIWRTNNFGESWNLIPIADSMWYSGKYYQSAQAEISIADPQIVWAGIYMAQNGRIHLSTDGGFTFNPASEYDKAEMGRLTGFDSHPQDANTAFAIFSAPNKPKILKTTNLGQSWNDITGFEEGNVSKNGFPDVVTYCVLVMPFNNDILWAGTEIGLFESTDGGQNWHLADNGLPRVSIWQMRIVNDHVVAATHGRGIWSVQLPALADYQPPKTVLAPVVQRSGEAPSGKVALETNFRSEYDSLHIILNGELFERWYDYQDIDTKIHFLDYVVSEKENVTGHYIVYKEGRSYRSGNFEITSYPLNEYDYKYIDDFEEDKGNFGMGDFKIEMQQNFQSGALNSRHPYRNDREETALLLTPVIVADENAFFEYEDIAIVEPGEEGSKFGDTEFWDYVIVEATMNGIEWVPLEPGYDSNYDEDWLAYYNKETNTLDESLYRKHSIDLHEHFEPGDTVLIRFRLFADTYTNGWGWIVDNLSVQENGIVSAEENINFNFDMSIYPNPASSFAEIQYTLQKEKQITLSVFDIFGNEIETLFSGRQSPGTHKERWNSDYYPAGTYFVRLISEDRIITQKMIVKK